MKRKSKLHKKNKSLDPHEVNAIIAGGQAADIPQVNENSPLYGLKGYQFFFFFFIHFIFFQV